MEDLQEIQNYVIHHKSAVTDCVRLGVVAQGERAERLKRGIIINDKVYNPEVWTPEEAQGVDLLIVSVKYGALRQAVTDIKKIVSKNTIVMSLMNGVDSEEIIAKEIGMSNIVHSLIKVASRRDGEGYRFNPETTIGIIFGEKKEPYRSERIVAIEELFKDSGVHYRSTEYIVEEMWSKFRLNVCNNLPQAVLGAGVVSVFGTGILYGKLHRFRRSCSQIFRRR